MSHECMHYFTKLEKRLEVSIKPFRNTWHFKFNLTTAEDMTVTIMCTSPGQKDSRLTCCIVYSYIYCKINVKQVY